MSRLPAVRDGRLITTPDAAPVSAGTPAWFAWLGEARSFTFSGAHGTFTARHESRSAGQFWYAYRRQDGRLRKAYLGRTADLSLDRLEHAAQALTAGGTKRLPNRDPAHAMEQAPEPLIATKIVMPQPGLSLIARPTVLVRCLECIEHPCALIAAPAGFGKTTLLLLACDRLRADGWQVAWLSLEESERDPTRFWTYMLAALDGARPGIAAALRPMIETPRPRPIEHLLTALINELAMAATPLALVLDDYHRAETPAHDTALAFLIEHLPATLHLILTARADPALPLTRLRAQGRIAELHAADVRFSAEEVERFLRDTMHVALPADQVARLEQRTEGWVAGLQLAALSWREQASMGGTSGTDGSVAEGGTTPPYIAEYLIAEVLEHQSMEVQEFLLRTAVLERLSGPLCDAVTGRADGAAMLARLMRAQLFVTPLDAGQTWFRYHHLFADVLCERLRRTAPGLWEDCHRRAADWLRGQGMTGEAIRHLTTAQAYAEAAELIEGESDRLILRGEVTGLVAQVRALPREVALAHPHLCALFAVALLLMSEGVEAIRWVEQLERHLRDTRMQTPALAGEIAAARAIILLMSGDFGGGARLANEAIRHLAPGDSLLRGLALWITSVVGILDDEDCDAIIANVARMADESMQTGNILMAHMALDAKAAVELYQGRLYQAARTCRDALRLSAPSKRELPISALAQCLLGEIQREWNDLEGAEAAVRRAFEVAAAMTTNEFVNDGFVTLARIQAAQGHYDEALATFEQLRATIRIQQLVSWDLDQMEIVRVGVLIAAGRVAEAVRWAEGCRRARQRATSAAPALLRDLEDLALARVALACGRPSEVIAPLEELCARATRAGRLRNVLDARILLARARWMLDERPAALSELEFALALAAPENFVRVFLDEGQSLAFILAAYAANHPPSPVRAHALKLLAVLGYAPQPAFDPSAGPSVERAASVPTLALSARELDVLRLLAAGRSNEAIAGELVVALSTVKWHVAHIYRKLGVAGRVQAAARARELRLIA